VICGYGLKHIIYCGVCHFALGFFAGLLVYLLTLTILSHTRLGGVEDSSIHRFSLVVALSCAVAVHILEDYTLGWF